MTGAATRRDRRDWPYAHALYRGDRLLIETIHGSIGSIMAEVMASAARVERGEADRIEVDGLPEERWRTWAPQPRMPHG